MYIESISPGRGLLCDFWLSSLGFISWWTANRITRKLPHSSTAVAAAEMQLYIPCVCTQTHTKFGVYAYHVRKQHRKFVGWLSPPLVTVLFVNSLLTKTECESGSRDSLLSSLSFYSGPYKWMNEEVEGYGSLGEGRSCFLSPSILLSPRLSLITQPMVPGPWKLYTNIRVFAAILLAFLQPARPFPPCHSPLCSSAQPLLLLLGAK